MRLTSKHHRIAVEHAHEVSALVTHHVDWFVFEKRVEAGSESAQADDENEDEYAHVLDDADDHADNLSTLVQSLNVIEDVKVGHGQGEAHQDGAAPHTLRVLIGINEVHEPVEVRKADKE